MSHAVLSASSAHKWLNCPPSARLEEQFPDVSSTFAEEGTLAHAFAELKLKKQFLQLTTKSFNTALKALQQEPLYSAEMLTFADEYVEYISQIVYALKNPPYIVVEKKLSYEDYAPEGFGTGDCIILEGGMLHVIDFKYGKGVPVYAESNPQMRLYALGALAAYSMTYDIRRIKTHIVQPRLNNFSSEELSAEDLKSWGTSIRPVAEDAFAGIGEYNPGEHCRFCRAKAQCRARADRYSALQDFGQVSPRLLSAEEIGNVLELALDIEKWIKDLQEYTLAECLQGNSIPGWKAVEGRSIRQFSDIDAAFGVLKQAGYNDAVLYKREPLTLTQVEGLLGKKVFKDLLDGFTVKPPGKPALVKESDKREAITRISAEEEFGSEQDEAV